MNLLPDNPQRLNEVIFENRNKAYGAYALRRDQDKRTLAGLLFTCAVFVATAMITTLGGAKLPDIDIEKKIPLFDTTTFINVWEEKPKEEKIEELQKEKPQQKTDPGNNFQASNTVEDSVKTNRDIKNLVIGPKSQDTAKTGGTGDTKNIVGLPKPEIKDTIPFRIVANMPVFKGDFLKWLKDNTVYPQMARENGITGTVYVTFVVDETGAVVRSKVENTKSNYMLQKEALRVLANCPNWTPGNDGSRNVKVAMTVPLTFTMR